MTTLNEFLKLVKIYGWDNAVHIADCRRAHKVSSCVECPILVSCFFLDELRRSMRIRNRYAYERYVLLKTLSCLK